MSKLRPLASNAKNYSEKAEKVFEGVRFDVYQWQQKQFDDFVATYEIVKRNDSVIVLPIINENELILVKEEQPHWEKPGITIVAGMVNPEEDLIDAARRELEEETGLIFKDYYLVYIEPVVPGIEWTAYTFVASGYVGEKPKKLDAGERNEILKVSFDDLLIMTRNKELYYRPRFIEEFLIQDKIEELKDLIKNPVKYVVPV